MFLLCSKAWLYFQFDMVLIIFCVTLTVSGGLLSVWQGLQLCFLICKVWVYFLFTGYGASFILTWYGFYFHLTGYGLPSVRHGMV